MMKFLARILYEDSRDPVGREYGPHVFVRACVADRFDSDLYDPRLKDALVASPLKGFGNVKREIERARLRPQHVELLALVDGDRAWRGVGLTRGATDEEVCSALLGDPPPERVKVYILHANLETLLHAIATRTGWPWDAATKASLDQRDRMLVRASRDLSAEDRRQVLQAVPAVGALVDRLEVICRPHLVGTSP